MLSARLRDDEVQPSELSACSQPTLKPVRAIASTENSHVSPKERDLGVLSLAESLRSARLGNRSSFMASLFTDPDLRRNNSELLHVLASVLSPTGPQVEPCDLPGMEEAETLFDK